MNLRTSLICLLTLVATTLFAQKPPADLGLTINAAQPAQLTIQGDRRVAEDGTPKVIYRTNYTVSPAAPEAMAKEYLTAAAAELRLTEADLEQLQLHYVRERPVGTTVRLRQFHEGIRVHGGEVSLTIRPNRIVGMVNNDFVHGSFPTLARPTLDRTRARALMNDHLQPVGNVTDVTHELRWFKHQGSLRLTHRITYVATKPLGQWEAFVDAQTGELLRVTDIAAYGKHDHMKPVVPFPMMVSGTGNVFNPDPLSTAGVSYFDSGYGDARDAATPNLVAEQVNVVLPEITQVGGTYFLTSQYAEIHDVESPFRGVFSRSNNSWNVNRADNAFEAVNCFYHLDASMRYINENLGLDIRPSAYPGGVRVDPSGVNGNDQSWYIRGSQRLAFGDGGVDDGEDSDVIHHELGHGLHDWVTGGGLSQEQGLSEGCGDYWAASYNRGLNLWSPNDPAYGYVFNWDGHNEFWPGRSVAVSTRWSPGLGPQGVHFSGQVWATSMMKVWDAMGQRRTDLIFWEGIGMTGGNSNQNDAANAVYQVALDSDEFNEEDRQKINQILTEQGYVLPDFEFPVTWVRAAAEARAKTVEITWTTANERGTARFIIERSANGGQTFVALGRQAAAGESTAEIDYRFVDTDPLAGNSIYRIRQLDQDGSADFSPLMPVTFGASGAARIYPNPVGNRLQMALPAGAGTVEGAKVINLAGQVVLENLPVSGASYDVSELAAGVYLLSYRLNGVMEVQRFVKQ